jgi:hypothetical protein
MVQAPALLRSMFQRAWISGVSARKRGSTSSKLWVGVLKLRSSRGHCEAQNASSRSGVSTSTRPDSRCGWSRASCSATSPPTEEPTTCTFSSFSASSTASTAAPYISMVWWWTMRSESPWPG